MKDLGQGSYSVTDLPTSVEIGKYSSVAAEVDFMTDGNHLAAENHSCVYTTNWDQPSTPTKIIIGNDVWIGRAVKIFDGIKIGNGAIVGAYTVVTKDVPAFSVVMGNPMRISRMRFTPEQVDLLEQIKWWDWKSEVIDERKQDMKDINAFLEKYKV